MKLKMQGHEVNIFDISFAHVEDLIDVVKLDEIEFGTRDELKKCIKDLLPKIYFGIRPIVLSMFNMTEDELKKTTIDELADNVSFILFFALDELTKCSSTTTTTKSKRGNDNVPLYRILFELQLSLCDRFSSLNPFVLRREKAKDVFLLVQRLNVSQSVSKEHSERSDSDVIRRPAQDDSWF